MNKNETKKVVIVIMTCSSVAAMHFYWIILFGGNSAIPVSLIHKYSHIELADVADSVFPWSLSVHRRQ